MTESVPTIEAPTHGPPALPCSVARTTEFAAGTGAPAAVTTWMMTEPRVSPLASFLPPPLVSGGATNVSAAGVCVDDSRAPLGSSPEQAVTRRVAVRTAARNTRFRRNGTASARGVRVTISRTRS